MKALLTWHKVIYDKTHDLDSLKKLFTPAITGTTIQLAGIGEPSKYAWRFRYPGAPYVPGREEAEEALSMASKLFDAINARLETEFNGG